MQRHPYILQFALAAVVAILLGALGGWYFFVKSQIKTTQASDVARGADLTPSFGNAVGSVKTNTAPEAVATSTSEPKRAPRLWQMSRTPAAGIAFSASSTAVFFVESATGNILRASPETSEITRITNTLIPKITEAIILSDGKTLLRAAADSGISTFAGKLSTSTPTLSATATPQTLQGIYLQKDILSMAASRNTLFYIVKDASGVVGMQSDWSGGGQKKLFSSSLTGWRTQLLADGRIILTQNASDGVVGYSYQIKPGGSLATLISGLAGLTVKPKSGSPAILFSASGNGNVALYGQAKTDASAVRLSLKTIADKCAWAPGTQLIAYCAVPKSIPNPYLDAWYQGAVHTADGIWRVNVSDGSVEKVYVPDNSTVIDVVSMAVNDAGTYITFINAVDRTPWTLRVSE